MCKSYHLFEKCSLEGNKKPMEAGFQVKKCPATRSGRQFRFDGRQKELLKFQMDTFLKCFRCFGRCPTRKFLILGAFQPFPCWTVSTISFLKAWNLRLNRCKRWSEIKKNLLQFWDWNPMNQIVLHLTPGLETALALHIREIFKYSTKYISNLKLSIVKYFCYLPLAWKLLIAKSLILTAIAKRDGWVEGCWEGWSVIYALLSFIIVRPVYTHLSANLSEIWVQAYFGNAPLTAKQPLP